MSLARLVPISLEKSAEAKKFEIVLDYVGGYLLYKDVNGDIVPVKAKFNDRTDLFINSQSRLINSKFAGGSIGDGYYSDTTTNLAEYIPIVHETDDNVTLYDSNIDQIVARLNKQGATNYTKDANHINIVKSSVNVKDAKYNASISEVLKTLSIVFPLSILSNILYEESTPETGIVYKNFQNLIYTMIDDISKRMKITDYNSNMLNYIQKGLASYDSTAPYNSYPTVKAIVDAIESRYTKVASDKRYIPKGVDTTEIDTFDAGVAYNGYRTVKAIADILINLQKYTLPKASNDTDLGLYNSQVPYTNYTSIKAIIDALIPKGATWDSTKEPYKSLATIAAIADAINNRYTKTETDNAFIKATDGIKKGATAAEITTYTNTAPYNNYTTLKLIVDAIESRYTKTETDALLNKKYNIATTPEAIDSFNSDTKYNELRDSKSLVDFILAFRNMSYIKDEIDISLSGKLDKGGSLPTGYETALVLANKIIELESTLLSSKNPIRFELMGTGYGQVYSIMDKQPQPEVNVPGQFLVTTAERYRQTNACLLGWYQHFGDCYYINIGALISDVEPDNIDTLNSDNMYKVSHPFTDRQTWSGTNDMTYYGSLSHSQSHADNIIDISTDAGYPIVTIMNNRVSKYMHVLYSAGTSATSPTAIMRNICGRDESAQEIVIKVSNTGIFGTDVYNSAANGGDVDKKNAVCRLTDYGITKDADNFFIQAIRTLNKVNYYKFYKTSAGQTDADLSHVTCPLFGTSVSYMTSLNNIPIYFYDRDGSVYANKAVTVTNGYNSGTVQRTTDATGKITLSSWTNYNHESVIFSATTLSWALVNPCSITNNVEHITSQPSLSVIKEKELKYVESYMSKNGVVVTVSCVEYTGYNGIYFNFMNYGVDLISVGSLSYIEDIFDEGYAGLTSTDRAYCKLIYVDTHENDGTIGAELVELYYYHTQTKKIYKASYAFAVTSGTGLTIDEPRYSDTGNLTPVTMTIANGGTNAYYAASIKLDGVYLPSIIPNIKCSIAGVYVSITGLNANTNAAYGTVNLSITNNSGGTLRFYEDILKACTVTKNGYTSTIIADATVTVTVDGAVQNSLRFVETEYHLEKKINGYMYNIPDNLINPYSKDAMSNPHKVYRITKNI